MKTIMKSTKNNKIFFKIGETRYREQTFLLGIGRTKQKEDKDYLTVGVNLFWIFACLYFKLPEILQRKEDEEDE